MKLPNSIKIALDIFEKNGYEAYVVGGAVRDYLLGIKVSDYDLATNAKPEVIISLFKKYNMHTKGLKHGTVTVFINGEQIEITTFRIEDKYIDHRRPKTVKFINNLYEDLARRDFTINAFAYNKKLYDYFNGREDLQNRLIRCVGDSEARFSEDALRIIRALRFSAQLNFTIEENTRQAIFTHKDLLNHISSERITIELDKILNSNIENVLIPYFDVFKVIIPELEINQTKENLQIIKKLPKKKELLIAGLLYKVKDSQTILLRLKYSNKIIKNVLTILENANIKIKKDKINIKKILLDIDLNDFENIYTFQKAKGLKLNIDTELKEALDEDYRVEHLDIKGSDLIAFGVPKNEQIGIILRKLIIKVIEGKLSNNKEVLLNYVNKVLNDQKS